MSGKKTEKTESVVKVKPEPEDDAEVISIACDPWSVKDEPSAFGHESWPRLQVKVWVESAPKKSFPNP